MSAPHDSGIESEDEMIRRFGWLIPVSALVVLVAFAIAASAPGYHVVKTYKLGGDGGWDYLTLDPASRRCHGR